MRTIGILCIALLAGCASNQKPSSSNAIMDAENLGRTLYNNLTSEDGSSPYTSREADVVKMVGEEGVASDGHYKAVSIFNEQDGVENLFLVLFPDSEGVQFGRHFRFQFRAGTNDLIDVSPSTKTCLLVPVTGDSVPFSTHLLSDVPNEFHVFLSLYHNKQIYVSTRKGLWSVNGGKISHIEK